jgi:acyl dehydratase
VKTIDWEAFFVKKGVPNFDDIRVGQVLKTEKCPVTERKMILGILWEGDLELHTNKERMIQSSFGERIVHGDAVTALVTGLFLHSEPFSLFKWKIENIECAYLRPVYIDDEITGYFEVTEKIMSNSGSCQFRFAFKAMKSNEEVVSSGHVSIALKCDESKEVWGFDSSLSDVTPGKTVTYSDLTLFEEAMELPAYRGDKLKIPETLVLMMSIGLMNRKLPLDDTLIAVVSNSWSFQMPVYVNDTLKVNYRVIETKKTQKGDKKIVTFELNTFNQHSEKVAEGKWTILVKCKV